MARHTGLGKGLNALIPPKKEKAPEKTEAKNIKPEASVKPEPSAKPETKAVKAATAAKPEPAAKAEPSVPLNAEIKVKISLVEPNRSQPRKTFADEPLKELADSIRQFGVIQPLLVQKKDGYYEIIAGERRWRAAKMAGLKEVPVLVKDFTNQQAVEISLIENIQREDLNPIEEARAYKRLIDEFTLTQDVVADRVSKSRTAVTNSMRLLKLDERVQNMVIDGSISEGHARAILAVPDPEVQVTLAEKVFKEHLSVRQTETIVRNMTQPMHTAKKKAAPDAQHEAVLHTISEQLKSILGTKVEISQVGKNKGRIEIEYYSEDELERIYDLLRTLRGEQA